MPQQRRRIAFSNKKKKEQLLQKRHLKSSQKYLKPSNDSQEDDGETTEDTEFAARKLMEQPLYRGNGTVRNKNVNRYNLQFYQESKKELEQMRLEAYDTLKPVDNVGKEIDDTYYDGYDFPIRPPWNSNMSKEQLERNENGYLRTYIDRVQKMQFEKKENSLYELNLETWRQLWRVLEMSDILLIIVDVRYSSLMFPPSLYKYIIDEIKKKAILVLNKVDLVKPEVVVAWREYFNQKYPTLPVVLFASYKVKISTGNEKARLGHRRCMEGVRNIFRACQKIVQNDVDLNSWEQKIVEDSKADNVAFDDRLLKTTEDSPVEEEQDEIQLHDGLLTLGCIGFPNVGKSSLLNALKGRKVVSVSHTPGHTKHFQTIFLTKDVVLCDCPGLVFPSATPKHLQVLIGSYPISQLKVPYRSLKFLCEHINVMQLLKLQMPEDMEEWSAAAVSDAWAFKRGFLTAKAARPDRYRAANHLLRMCLAGQQQLILQLYPPKFHALKDKWLTHSTINEIRKYQDPQMENSEQNDETSSLNSDSCDSDDDNSSSSNDETNADCEDDSDRGACGSSQNAFALLADN